MLRRGPLKAKRDTPRRNEGRVQHKRIKPTATGKTAEEARFIEMVAGLGCLICGAPAVPHHLMIAPGKIRRRDHRFACPLCVDHHTGQWGVHWFGSEALFRDYWGVDLLEWAIAAWGHRNAPDAPFWTDGILRLRGIARTKILEQKRSVGERERTKDALYPT